MARDKAQKPGILKRRFAKDTKSKKAKQLMKATKLIGRGQGFKAKLATAVRILKALKLGSAATLVGIIVTFIVMNLQLILWGVKYLPVTGVGKSFGVKIEIPLSISEFVILLFIWLLIFLALGILIIVAYIIHKCSGITAVYECPIPGLTF